LQGHFCEAVNTENRARHGERLYRKGLEARLSAVIIPESKNTCLQEHFKSVTGLAGHGFKSSIATTKPKGLLKAFAFSICF
jgi:hypothetical protein